MDLTMKDENSKINKINRAVKEVTIKKSINLLTLLKYINA